MIFRMNHYIERGDDEFGVQVEAEYTPAEAPTYWASPGRMVSPGADADMEIISVTWNGAEFKPTPEEREQIMQDLWDDIAQQQEDAIA